MNDLLPIANRIDAGVGLLVTVLSYIFGKHWFLFVAFLGLNIADYLTGWLRSKKLKTINSSKGASGILKKLGYWIMILLGFGMSFVFIEIGEVIGVNLQISSAIGWFVLSLLIINEFRSNIENLVEAGYWVPKIMQDGLEVANKVLDSTTDTNQGGKE